jgi:flagellar basal-body rod protein FlgC
MSLFNTFDIAGSALHAQSVRLNTVSSNLANANSVSSSTEDTYRAKQPVFKALMNNIGNDMQGVGVRVEQILESQEPLRTEYNPGHPYANEEGFITLPNVNMVEEMANMISASRSYQTNVEVMNTAKQMMLRTLQMGQ